LLKQPIKEPDYEYLMVDASHIKAHAHAAGTKGGNPAMNGTKEGLTRSHIWPWMRMVCHTPSTATDCIRL